MLHNYADWKTLTSYLSNFLNKPKVYLLIKEIICMWKCIILKLSKYLNPLQIKKKKGLGAVLLPDLFLLLICKTWRFNYHDSNSLLRTPQIRLWHKIAIYIRDWMEVVWLCDAYQNEVDSHWCSILDIILWKLHTQNQPSEDGLPAKHQSIRCFLSPLGLQFSCQKEKAFEINLPSRTLLTC